MKLSKKITAAIIKETTHTRLKISLNAFLIPLYDIIALVRESVYSCKCLNTDRGLLHSNGSSFETPHRFLI